MKIKKLSAIILCVLMLTMVLCFAGCTNNVSKYVGKYHSIFVDAQNDEDNIEVTLEIKDDNTFIFSKSTLSSPYKGTWKSYTESNKTQLLCLIEEGWRWNSWHPYFTVSMLDDGTLMAVPGSTVNIYGKMVTAFDADVNYYITLILFEKN